MLRKTVYALLVALSLVVGSLSGYFVREFQRLQEENVELTRISLDALDAARRIGGTANACIDSLNSCSRIINAENPQIRDEMLRIEAQRWPPATSISQRRGQ